MQQEMLHILTTTVKKIACLHSQVEIEVKY